MSTSRITVSGVPESFDAIVLASIVEQSGELLHVTRDDLRSTRLAEALMFFAPDIEVINFPAWNCLPYDRISPSVNIMTKRIKALSCLSSIHQKIKPRIVLASASAILQRVPCADTFISNYFSCKIGEQLDSQRLFTFLSRNGYVQSNNVTESGEFALRGNIIDIFPPCNEYPIRIDLFGDNIDQIRIFDLHSQCSISKIEYFDLYPVNEITLNKQSINLFRSGYCKLFGTITVNTDPLYDAISNGIKFVGMEHWLPLFYNKLTTLFTYLPNTIVTLDYQTEIAIQNKIDMITRCYNARAIEESAQHFINSNTTTIPYHPLSSIYLYLDQKEWSHELLSRKGCTFTPFAITDGIDAGGRIGYNFSESRSFATTTSSVSVYDSVIDYFNSKIAIGQRIIIATFSSGSAERLKSLLIKYGFSNQLTTITNWKESKTLPIDNIAFMVHNIEHGFSSPELSLFSEQDILGYHQSHLLKINKDRSNSISKKFLAETTNLSENDLVVHIDHGIGRYSGLITIDVSGILHDCLCILYDGDDKLFVPVENINVLSRYGVEHTGIHLDKLGSVSWQNRKAKIKKRICDMTEKLIAVSAERRLRTAEILVSDKNLYNEFCIRFPYVETEDQLNVINNCIEDLKSGNPMDQLVCGDVGFGKTEVALRIAFIVAINGYQVAILAPTTLLARQHYQTFSERFKDFPIKIAHLSRLINSSISNQIRNDITKGVVDIIIGTHALLSKNVTFKNLALLIVDEEQHFGVIHKELLKQLKSNIHVLTLTATPIPRTLQMALAGVRKLSVIATPPIDRLAVNTFVLPFDIVVIREAIQRERLRGGQIFYVCPHLSDINDIAKCLDNLIPEISFNIAHGQMKSNQLEKVIIDFTNGNFDVLISTNIIESGLDMPRVNTLIVHRSDMFGLSQLYQLRGRVGRSKLSSYAYFTIQSNKILSKTAEKRLSLIQTLNDLGNNFMLASYDLDLRGAGNLLGDEQSGNIREVGIELYQKLTEEAVIAIKKNNYDSHMMLDNDWYPNISLGIPILIPANYIADLSIRLSFYRRIGAIIDDNNLNELIDEMIDRFGKLPSEVNNLLEVVAIKIACKQAGIEKIEAGPKGTTITLRNNNFTNTTGLINFVSQHLNTVKLLPNNKMIFYNNLDKFPNRISGVKEIIKTIIKINNE
ncbi:MAG: transcription-repair coupling factor [Rhodospirillaceae bacterium]|jgi:transcription-repair coupling factor (superfamily II helicase)|nr:transcription-repair coupling factor [Rhodospirillaceae bacterium]